MDKLEKVNFFKEHCRKQINNDVGYKYGCRTGIIKVTSAQLNRTTASVSVS